MEELRRVVLMVDKVEADMVMSAMRLTTRVLCALGNS